MRVRVRVRVKDLMHHAQIESSRVIHHRKLAALLEDPHVTSLLAANTAFDNRKDFRKAVYVDQFASPPTGHSTPSLICTRHFTL